MSRAAIFLDRDGTLNEDVGYLDRIERLRLFPWSLEAIRLCRQAGYAVVVTTNQAGVARGMIGEAIVDEVADEIRRRLAAIGEALDGHYMCPHHPDGSVSTHAIDCDCRKPGPGLVRRAGHVAPAQAFCDALFARDSVVLWIASRGFGGKTSLLALLAAANAIP